MNLQEQLTKENLHILIGDPSKNEIVYATKEKTTNGIKPAGTQVFMFIPKDGFYEKV